MGLNSVGLAKKFGFLSKILWFSLNTKLTKTKSNHDEQNYNQLKNQEFGKYICKCMTKL